MKHTQVKCITLKAINVIPALISVPSKIRNISDEKICNGFVSFLNCMEDTKTNTSEKVPDYLKIFRVNPGLSSYNAR